MADTQYLPPLAPSLAAPITGTAIPAPPAAAAIPDPLPTFHVRGPARLLAVALILGGSVDLLFYGQDLGISLLLFAGGLLVGLFALGWREDALPVRRNLWLVAPIVFFAAMAAVHANSFLTVLNILATLTLLALLVYFYAEGRVERLGLVGYLAACCLSGINAWVQTPPLVRAGIDLRGARRHGGRWIAPVLRGLILAVPMLGLFTLLLASADMIFADVLAEILHLDFLRRVPELLGRLTIVLAATWGIAGGLVYSLGRHAGPPTDTWAPPGAVPPAQLIGATEVATILVTVNALFAAFVAIQFTYLFGGSAMSRVADHDYKEYAHRGFGELVLVSLLTLGLILGLRWLARFDTPRHTRLFQALCTVLILLTLVILASAWSRMLYWEAVTDYIATALRLYVRVFIAWLGLLFLWTLGTLWVRPERFALGAFLAALGFLATLNLMNPDDAAVRCNIARAQVTHELYMPYLAGLSDDAVPAMIELLDQAPGPYRDELRAILRNRLADLESHPGWRAWQAFNLAHTHAYDLLTANRARLAGPAVSPGTIADDRTIPDPDQPNP